MPTLLEDIAGKEVADDSDEEEEEEEEEEEKKEEDKKDTTDATKTEGKDETKANGDAKEGEEKKDEEKKEGDAPEDPLILNPLLSMGAGMAIGGGSEDIGGADDCIVLGLRVYTNKDSQATITGNLAREKKVSVLERFKQNM